jgi:Uma2 family endonuclease
LCCYDPLVTSALYDSDPYEQMLVPRGAVRLPLIVLTPPDFDAARLETWPHVDGRLEFVEGRLQFMPPCGDDQQDTAADVATELNLWRRAHEQFVVGANEAGMKLGDDVRAADAAVWRRSDLGGSTGGLRRVPPILAVEIAGRDDTIALLRDKAAWYLSHGVEVAWLLIPPTRTAIVLTSTGEFEYSKLDTIAEHPSLPGLSPRVADLFRQLG